jgi:hypothetical protein
MKETAVEFLVDEFKEKLIGHNLPEWVEKIIEQAKAMENEQIIDAYYQGDADSDNIHVDAEQYYKETFKSE